MGCIELATCEGVPPRESPADVGVVPEKQAGKEGVSLRPRVLREQRQAREFAQ